LIFSPGRFILKNHSIGDDSIKKLCLLSMTPWMITGNERFSGNIISKQNLVLFCGKKLFGGLPGTLWKEVLGESWGLCGRESFGPRAADLEIAIDNCPDSQPLPLAPGVTSIDHD
jgi:hypothetical protein